MQEDCSKPEEMKVVSFIEESFETDADLESFRKYVKKHISEGIVNLTFQKKDGTMRDMRCTTKFDHIPEDKIPMKSSDPNKKVRVYPDYQCRVFDLDANDWRSFNTNTLVKFNLFHENMEKLELN